MKMRLAILAAMAVMMVPVSAGTPSGTSPSTPQTGYVRYAQAQCMMDDGYGRFRPCDARYKRDNPNWRAGDACMTDDGYGRYRPCDARYKNGGGGGRGGGRKGTTTTAPGDANRPRILETGYSALGQLGSEEAGYGLYSYVILTSNSDRSAKLLEQIFRSIPAVEDTAPDLRRSQINILYIPGGAIARPANTDPSRVGTEYSASLYNYPMAHSLLNHVCNPPDPTMSELCAGDMDSGGPYLFSYARPASTVEPVPPPFLFLDLSDVHPGAFAEFVSAFRAQVKREDISDGARISSLRLKLLSIVLTASDWVRPVQKAVADIVRAPGSGNSSGSGGSGGR